VAACGQAGAGRHEPARRRARASRGGSGYQLRRWSNSKAGTDWSSGSAQRIVNPTPQGAIGSSGGPRAGAILALPCRQPIPEGRNASLPQHERRLRSISMTGSEDRGRRPRREREGVRTARTAKRRLFAWRAAECTGSSCFGLHASARRRRRCDPSLVSRSDRSQQVEVDSRLPAGPARLVVLNHLRRQPQRNP